MRLLLAAFFCACGGSVAPTTNSTAPAPANTAPIAEPDPLIRGDYVGRYVGFHITHFGQPSSRQTLPPELELQNAINVADGFSFTLAKRDADLTLLLTTDGVVVDDVTMRGRAEHVALVGECDSAFIGIADAGACRGQTTIEVAHAWQREGRTLVDEGPQICNCAFYNELESELEKEREAAEKEAGATEPAR